MFREFEILAWDEGGTLCFEVIHENFSQFVDFKEKIKIYLLIYSIFKFRVILTRTNLSKQSPSPRMSISSRAAVRSVPPAFPAARVRSRPASTSAGMCAPGHSSCSRRTRHPSQRMIERFLDVR